MPDWGISIIFTTAILLAEAVFLHPLPKREPAVKYYLLAFPGAYILLLLLRFIPDANLIMPLIKACIVLAILSLLNFCVSRCEKGAAVYLSIWSLISTHFIYILWTVIPLKWKYPYLSLSLLYLIFFCIIYFTLARLMPNDDGSYHIGPRQMSSAVILIAFFEILYFALINSPEIAEKRPLRLAVVLAQLYCITMLYFQTELFKKGAIEKEYLTMNLLWEKQKEQYLLAKENIELINRKTHDLKHHVLALRNMTDEAQKEKYFKEIENSLEIYGSIVRTGNQVLDTILTDKSLLCNAKDIKIHCIVDGSKLSFIDPIDLYAILGNAVDNAIAGVSQIKEKERRIIDLNIFSKDAFLIINISNPLAEIPEFKDGLPVSRRAKSGYHGYGMRSISYNVKKYDGHMSVSIENNCFVLKIVFPRPAAG